MRARSQWKPQGTQPSQEHRGSRRRLRRLTIREHTDAWTWALLAWLLFALLATIGAR